MKDICDIMAENSMSCKWEQCSVFKDHLIDFHWEIQEKVQIYNILFEDTYNILVLNYGYINQF